MNSYISSLVKMSQEAVRQNGCARVSGKPAHRAAQD